MDAFISDLDIIGDLALPGGYSSLGDVDIVGGDDSQFVTEALQGMPASGGQAIVQAAAMQRARQIDPGAVAVRNQVLKKLGYQPAGIAATVFPIATPQQIINLSVTRPYKPYELLVPSSLAPFFQLDSATINGNNQLATAGPVPLENFSDASFRSKFRWETVNPSSPLVLVVTMIDLAVQRTLRMSFIGAALMR